ncbi:MAG: type II secretion system F family protein [bacterium]
MKVLLATVALFFLVSVITIELLLFGYRKLNRAERRKVKKRLRTLAYEEGPSGAPQIVRKRVLSSVPALNELLLHSPVRRFERLTRQANAEHPLGVYLLLTLVLMASGSFLAFLYFRSYPVSVLAGLACGTIPYLYLVAKKKHRMERFQKQLPEALELIGRALRAGHAFTSGMKLAADQFDDPLGPEFEDTLDEINFGISVPDALKGLGDRVDCPDLKYFVISVIIQREAGGNLAEIIESIARIVRERFKFQDKLKVLAAEGKVSARILTVLPFLFIFAVSFLNPQYLKTLFTEPTGRTLCWVAGSLMILGILIMTRMAKIRV